MRSWISGIGRLAVFGARDDVTDARRLIHDTVWRKGPERQLVLQVLKSVVAAMLAWLIAIHVLDVRQPFVAPMIALLMVQPTIVQSLVKGTQQVAAVTVGMLTALVVFNLVDNTSVALGIALLITTVFATWRRLGDQGTYAPIVALTMISLQSVGETYFERRLLETVVGVLVGAAINFAVKPPHYLDSAKGSATTCVDDATGILRDIADGLRSGWSVDDARGWVARTERLQSQVSSCLEDLGWAGESIRLNFRRNRVDTATPTRTYRPVVDAVGSVAEPLEHFARTLAIRARDDQDGSSDDVAFLADCATLLDDIAEDVADWANAETPILAPSRTEENENDLATKGSRQLSELADRVRALPPAQVTYSGAMLIAIEQILDALRERPQPVSESDTSSS